MALQRNYRHFFEAAVKLVGPFWGRPRIMALLQSYINEVQAVESAAWDVLEQRHVNVATGVRLDTLGAIVGVPRFTSSDATYRNVIRAKIAANKSAGHADDLITVTRLAGDVASPVVVEHFSPATVTITLSETVTAEALAALAYLLPKTRAAGVRLGLVRVISGTGLLWGSSVDAGVGNDLDSSVTPITDSPTLYSVRAL